MLARHEIRSPSRYKIIDYRKARAQLEIQIRHSDSARTCGTERAIGSKNLETRRDARPLAGRSRSSYAFWFDDARTKWEHGEAEKDPARETRVAKIENARRGPVVFTLAAILFYHSVETQPRFATAGSAAIYIKPDPGTIATFYSYTASGGAGERALASMRGRRRAKEMRRRKISIDAGYQLRRLLITRRRPVVSLVLLATSGDARATSLATIPA